MAAKQNNNDFIIFSFDKLSHSLPNASLGAENKMYDGRGAEISSS